MYVCVLEILHEHVAGWLLLPDTAEKKKLQLIRGTIHRLQIHLRHTIAKLLAAPSRYQWLQLLEICHDTEERRVRLLFHNLKQAIPFQVLILAALVAQDEVLAAQGGRGRPLHLGIRPRALVVQYAVDGAHRNILYTRDIRKPRLEAVHQYPSRTYNEHLNTRARAEQMQPPRARKCDRGRKKNSAEAETGPITM